LSWIAALSARAQGAVIAPERLRGSAEGQQRIAAVPVRIGQIRPYRQCALVTLDRFLKATQCRRDVAVTEMRLRKPGVVNQRQADQPLRLVQTPSLRFQHPEQVKRIELVGLRAKNRPVQALGFRQIPGLVAGRGAPEPRSQTHQDLSLALPAGAFVNPRSALYGTGGPAPRLI
jgi:hypothetical protein